MTVTLPSSTIRTALALIGVGAGCVALGCALHPDSNLGGLWGPVGGVTLSVGVIMLVVAGIATLVDHVLSRRPPADD